MSFSAIVAGLLGLLFPAAYQALTGRLRAALLLLASLLARAALAFFFPAISLGMISLPLLSAADAARARHRGFRASKRGIAPALLVFVALIAEAQLLKRYLFAAYKIPSTSMVPTLAVGDHVFAERLSLLWSPPQRGDLVVFEGITDRGGASLARIGRIVAVGGDRIAIRHHVPVLGGTPAPQVAAGPARYSDLGQELAVTRFTETLGDHRYDVFVSPDQDPALGDLPQPERGCDAIRADAAAPRDVPAMQPTEDGSACLVPEGTFFFLGDNRWNSNDSRYQGVVPVAKILGRVRGLWFPGAPSLGARWSRLGRLE